MFYKYTSYCLLTDIESNSTFTSVLWAGTANQAVLMLRMAGCQIPLQPLFNFVYYIYIYIIQGVCV